MTAIIADHTFDLLLTFLRTGGHRSKTLKLKKRRPVQSLEETEGWAGPEKGSFNVGPCSRGGGVG